MSQNFVVFIGIINGEVLILQKFLDSLCSKARQDLALKSLLKGFVVGGCPSACVISVLHVLVLLTLCLDSRPPWAEGGGTQILLMVCRESLHLVILVAPSNLAFQDSVCAEVVSGWSAWAGPTAPNYSWYRISKWWNWDCWALPIKEGGCLASPTCLTHFMSLAKGVLSVAQSKRVIWSFLLGVSSAEI